MQFKIYKCNKFCNNDQLCKLQPNKPKNCYETNGICKMSLNNLGCLAGSIPYSEAGEGTANGAEFKSVKTLTPYYERTNSYIVIAPWLAQKEEATFLNRLKLRNEPPVKTYKELEFRSIPQQKYMNYRPPEGFGAMETQDYGFKILICLCIIFLIFLLLKNA